MEKLDVAFIDPDLGSLIAAASLAAVGIGVVVFSPQATSSASQMRPAGVAGGFPSFAEPFLIRGLKRGPFLEPILNRMGILVRAKDYVQRNDPACQVCLPGVRFTFYTDDDKFEDELRMEFGKNHSNAAEFFQGMDELASQLDDITSSPEFPRTDSLKLSAARLLRARPGGSSTIPEANRLKKPTLSQAYDKYNLDENVRKTINVLLMGLGLPPTADTPAAGAAQILGSARKGAIYRADMDELAVMVLEVLKKRGGYIFPLASLRGMNVTGNKITALTLTKATGVDASMFIGSIRLLEALEISHTKKKSKKKSKDEPSARAWTEHKIEVVIDEDVIPVGMAERVITYDAEADIVLTVSISKSFRADIEEGSGGTGVPEGERSVRILRAICNTPHHLPDPERTIFNALSSLIPFLRDYSYDGRYSKEAARPLSYSPDGFLAVPKSEYSNLYPPGEELLRQMGLGTGIVNGRIISRLAAKKLGLKADML